MPTIVGILTFMSRINCSRSWAEHERSFMTSGPGHEKKCFLYIYSRQILYDAAYNYKLRHYWYILICMHSFYHCIYFLSLKTYDIENHDRSSLSSKNDQLIWKSYKTDAGLPLCDQTLINVSHDVWEYSLTAVSGVNSSPTMGTCETTQVLLAGVPGFFSRGTPVVAPHTDWSFTYEVK